MIRVIVIGLGPIGISAAKAVLADKGLQLVGLVDVDPNKVGKTLSQIGAEVAGGPTISGIHVPQCGQAICSGSSSSSMSDASGFSASSSRSSSSSSSD